MYLDPVFLLYQIYNGADMNENTKMKFGFLIAYISKQQQKYTFVLIFFYDCSF